MIMILSIALLIGYLLTRQKGFYLAAQLIPISIFFSWSSMVNAQNSCSLPSSPLSTPTIYTVTVANCTTLVVRVYTNVTTSPKSLRFQVFTGGNYNNVTGVYCNLSNMNYTGSISGGYLYHNSNKTAIYGTNYYVLTLPTHYHLEPLTLSQELVLPPTILDIPLENRFMLPQRRYIVSRRMLVYVWDKLPALL